MWKLVILLSLFIYGAICVQIFPGSSPSTKVALSIYWDDCTQSAYFVDFFAATGTPTIFRYDNNEDKTYSAYVEGQPAALFIIPVKECNKYKNQFLVGFGPKAGVIEWDGKSPTAKFVGEVFNLNSNDPSLSLAVGQTDAQGHFYLGSFHLNFCLSASDAPVYMYVRPNSSKLIFSGTQATTGFASTSNKLYHIDSCLGKLTEFQKDCNGNICNGRVVFDFRSPIIPQAEKFPIGLDIDENGNLYTAAYADGTIFKVNPRTGSIQVIATVPGQGTAGLAFGGPNRDILFAVVGSAIVNPLAAKIEGSDISPSIYKITGLGVKGYKRSRLLA